ncbi:MAG: type I methionyl aminopeptidase [candidate division WOR-3 bacterium]
MLITLKGAKEIERIQKAGKIIAEAFYQLKKERYIRPDITTDELNGYLEQFIVARGGQPAFKGYRGFPKAVCISINDEVVHGIPSWRKIKASDLVKIDIGVEFDGYFADAARTFCVGEVDDLILKLCSITEQALKIAIRVIKAGVHLGDISYAIQNFVEKNGFSVVRELGGHGIGNALHEDPLVPNFGKPGTGPILEAGVVLAIEPMVNLGKPDVITAQDGWTVLTSDGLPSAHFEDTIYVTENGALNLTDGAA